MPYWLHVSYISEKKTVLVICAIQGQCVVLPGYTRQVGQHVVKIPVCYVSKCGELWKHNDGTAILTSPSCGTKAKEHLATEVTDGKSEGYHEKKAWQVSQGKSDKFLIWHIWIKNVLQVEPSRHLKS